jgi:hypothetical protein
MTKTKPTLSEVVEQLNNSNADPETTERVLAEYGYERVTAEQLQQMKEELGV